MEIPPHPEPEATTARAVIRLILDDHETSRSRLAELDGLRDDPVAAQAVRVPLAAAVCALARRLDDPFAQGHSVAAEGGRSVRAQQVCEPARRAVAAKRRQVCAERAGGS